MSFTIQESKSYDQPASAVFQAALGAVDGLGGKIVRQDEGTGSIEATFDKKILGKVLGDRTQLEFAVEAGGEDQSTVSLEVYPLDAVGRKLMFGARKGVAQTVVSWFVAHLEHRLG